MFGEILYISDTVAHIKIKEGTPLATNLMNMHIVFEDEKKKILGEVEDISKDIIKVHFLGEISNGRFIGGVIRKPTLSANIRIITKEELAMIVGEDGPESLLLGYSPLYDNYPVRVNINDLFANHMAIFGNTGSGKSCGVARLLQNVFVNPNLPPFRSNFFIFDAYGEYHNAFMSVNTLNPNFNFKFYTTNVKEVNGGEILSIPPWLLDVDDYALLLGATEHSQLPIIERMLKLTSIFAESSEQSLKYKNHLIAKAIMMILYTNQTSLSKRNDIFSILQTCSTPQFNLESVVQGAGYTRKFRECFIVNKTGEFVESILVTEYVSSFIDEELDKYEAQTKNKFTLEDLQKALNFTLISEGLLQNAKTYGDAITLKVRLHALVIGENAKYFNYPNFITEENYIASLVNKNGRKAQIVNFNLEDVEDSFAKVVTKIYTKMLFHFTKMLPQRASIPFHIFLEEAHRYVQNDTDKFLLGYNIFERVAKEGRKYGLIFNLISQRPVEISETVISQCTNFMIFKMNHPRDLEYIRKMLPNVSEEVVEKQKSLQPGTCVAFGKAFKVPMIIHMEMPNPEPSSSSCDIVDTWAVHQNKGQ